MNKIIDLIKQIFGNNFTKILIYVSKAIDTLFTYLILQKKDKKEKEQKKEKQQKINKLNDIIDNGSLDDLLKMD